MPESYFQPIEKSAQERGLLASGAHPQSSDCRACGHPLPKSGQAYTSLMTDMRKLSDKSTQGCVTCSILLRGITGFFAERGESVPEALYTERSLRLDFNVSPASHTSLEIQLLQNDADRISGRGVKLSFYCLESES